MSQRTDRIDELLRQEISSIISREVADPRIGFVTLTKVETSPDLAHARVWFSLIGQPRERAATLAALRRAMPFVRRQLGPQIRLRRIPELHVEVDESAERGTRVLQLLHELEAGREPEELPQPGESLPSPAPQSRKDEPEPLPPGKASAAQGGPRSERGQRRNAARGQTTTAGRGASARPTAHRARGGGPSRRPR